MLRTAPNFNNIRNRVPAHVSRYQTFDIVAVFVGKDKQNSPPEKPSLLWGSPVSRLPSAEESPSNDHQWAFWWKFILGPIYWTLGLLKLRKQGGAPTRWHGVLEHGLNLHRNIPLTKRTFFSPSLHLIWARTQPPYKFHGNLLIIFLWNPDEKPTNHQQTLRSRRINIFMAEEPVGAHTLFGPQGLPEASKAESSL